MAHLRRLSRAPIVEALVDFRVAANPKLTREQFEPIKAALKSRYPKAEEQRRFEGQFAFDSGRVDAKSRDLGFWGIFLRSEDNEWLSQFRTDGFTVNRLGRYEGADQLFSEARSLWALYVEHLRPEQVTRVALRYINRPGFPWRLGDEFSRFLTAAPIVPPEAPQSTSAFLTKVVTHDEGSGATAVVTQRVDTEPKGPATVIDVDVFRESEFGTGMDLLEPELQRLRDLKNRIFFSLLTDAAIKELE
ncbi:MAG: TIGR04255 family protein [Vicinamibacterales bacterium]